MNDDLPDSCMSSKECCNTDVHMDKLRVVLLLDLDFAAVATDVIAGPALALADLELDWA